MAGQQPGPGLAGLFPWQQRYAQPRQRVAGWRRDPAGTPHRFLARVSEEMTAAPHTDLFPDRYKVHVAYALRMVARHGFLEPPAAIAAVYLATRFEFFFRLLSGKLKGDGTWLNKAVDQPAAVAALGEKGLKGKRVSDVAVTYKLMKLEQSRPAARVFDSLDKIILPAPIIAVGSFEVGDIGDRKHPPGRGCGAGAAHGPDRCVRPIRRNPCGGQNQRQPLPHGHFANDTEGEIRAPTQGQTKFPTAARASIEPKSAGTSTHTTPT